jgi:hypothetical protein
MSRDTFGYNNRAASTVGILWAEARDAANYSTMYRPQPQLIAL